MVGGVILIGIALITKIALHNHGEQKGKIITRITACITHVPDLITAAAKDPHLLTEKELLEEYLNQQPMEFKLNSDELSYLQEKVVMVFGGAGSIGAELVRQLVGQGVTQLIVVDNHENSLVNLKKAMKDKMVNTELICLFGDIRNQKTLASIFATYQPNVIFHYANYKSVDMGLIAPKEFFGVNVIGTINLLKAAGSHQNVERFIYISSIRAQNPTEPYGRTKRISELLVKTFADAYPKIKFGSIRYSAVLDSAGSYAIPIFRAQIAHGKLVNLKRVENGEIPERYFIPRDLAAKLAIKVGSECNCGEVFSLDGDKIKPIKIDALIKLIAKKYGVINIDEWFVNNVKLVKGDPGEKNKKLPSSSSGDGDAFDAPIMKIAIVSDAAVLNHFLKTLLSLSTDLSDKEMGLFLRKILDEEGNLPRIDKTALPTLQNHVVLLPGP